MNYQRKIRIGFLFILIFYFCYPSRSLARPTSYEGATTVLSWNQTFLQDFWVTYSIDPKVAFTSRLMVNRQMGTPHSYFAPQLNLLVFRSNGSNSQANFFLYQGIGTARYQGKTNLGANFGSEADIESRQLYLMMKWESFWANRIHTMNHGEFRAGFAPYRAEYNELASWLFFQLQYNSPIRGYEPGLLVRMFYKNYLWETGISIRGDLQFNFKIIL